jgi:structural maintenance of chromosome 4
MKVKGFRKKLDDIQTNLNKHMDQYVIFFCFLMIAVCFVVSQVIMHLFLFRIQMDAIDPEKLKATLGDEQLQDTCDMKNAMEMVALLEAQLKDLSPNLDSIAEYVIMRYLGTKHIFLSVIFFSPG